MFGEVEEGCGSCSACDEEDVAALLGEVVAEGSSYAYCVALFHLVKVSGGVADVFDGDRDAVFCGVHYAEGDFVYGWYPEHEELSWFGFGALFVGERVGFGYGVFGFHAFDLRGADGVSCGELVRQFLLRS